MSSYSCPVPACGKKMFPSDIVCRACARRVESFHPGLFLSHDNSPLHDGESTRAYWRGAIVGTAIRTHPNTLLHQSKGVR